MDTLMKEFRIDFSNNQLDDLRRRLDTARPPQPWNGALWDYGTDSDYLSKLLAYWRDEYDWRHRERELNRYPQFTCELDGTTIHFFRIRSSRENAPALLLTHGWPDSFLRYAKLFPLLPDYDLVIPSLPGFAFSTLPAKGFSNNAETAELWHRLMTDVLDYKEYFASGGDMGRGVTCYLAANHPEEIRGIHLTDVGFAADLVAAPDETLTSAGLAYKQRAVKWQREEGAYINIQSTKPQTLAYALADSPAGMAARRKRFASAWKTAARWRFSKAKARRAAAVSFTTGSSTVGSSRATACSHKCCLTPECRL